MGDVKTTFFKPGGKTDIDLVAYREALLKMLIDAGLLKPESLADDVLIVRKPTIEEADSAFSLVISIEWSASNSDFTDASRTMDLSTLKPIIKRLVRDTIVPVFFPEVADVYYGCNVWLKRLDAAFVAGTSL